jgi:aspartyl protease family protein
MPSACLRLSASAILAGMSGHGSKRMGSIALRHVAACVALVCAQTALATTVELIALGPRSVDIIVDAKAAHSLRIGQTSPEGIELLEIAPDQATLSVDGQRVNLRLGETNRPAVVLRADRNGSYIATTHINGIPVDLMVDTGASEVVLAADVADRIGIAYRGNPQVRRQTANGEVTAYAVIFNSVRVGGIALTGVPGSVLPGNGLRMPGVLGMTFLNRVQMIRSRDTLTLTR